MRTLTTLVAMTMAGTLLATGAGAQSAEETRLTLIGEVAPRSASEIDSNRWSIGTETIDRDFSSYASWREHLGPLGAKHARLQSGWARTDSGGGVYDFTWLDPIVDDMNAQGVRPWISLSYGNPAYAGGGTAQRDSELPTGEGRQAWIAYVEAIVTRYRDKVDIWEIWNEPDLGTTTDGRTFGAFAAETAGVIRRLHPNARIMLAGLTSRVLAADGDRREFARGMLEAFVQQGGQGLATDVTYHPYGPNPDASYPDVEGFRTFVRSFDPGLEIRQGENGAPSINQSLFASRNIWWTEESQAKFLLRRMLGDAGRGIWTSIFTLTDLHYSVETENSAGFNNRRGAPARVAMNSKGLLETRRYAPGTADDDRTVVRTKIGYRAMQSITSIIDDALTPIGEACEASVTGVAVHAFRRTDGATLIAAWRATDRPGERPMHENVDILCRGMEFAGQTVLVDPLTSAVYRTTDIVSSGSNSVRLVGLPVYDSPILVADDALVQVW